MKNNIVKKIIGIILISIVCFNILIPSVFAMTSSYAQDTVQATAKANENSLLSVFADILLPMFYPIFGAIEKLCQKIVYSFTGTYAFPWADRIVFNSLPFLDVNFINPEPGSLFMTRNGVLTAIGKTVRSTYFTGLSICLAFFGIAVAINVIKMIIATLPSAKARYKELINATLMSLILIFGMHYVISFIFYINEQLVEVATDMSSHILSDDTIKAAQENLDKAEEENNETLVENFFAKCKHTSWWSPVTIVKKLVKEAVNLGKKILDWGKKIGESIKDAWDKFWGKDSEEEDITFSDKDKQDNGYYDEIFPSKNDFINYFKDESKVGKHGMDIAAFLMKDYIYRDYMLPTVAGNDTNKFANAGFWGWAQSASNTVLWVTGVVDTGLMGLQNLYNSVCFVVHDVPKNASVGTAAQINNTIDNLTSKENQEKDDDTIAAYHIQALYVKAYYRYVYEGNDKTELRAETSMIQNLGEYFKRNMYYTDVDNGDWSPDTFDAIMCILYCVFVVQSFMFLFSYIKRFFYVVILAILGPITVVFDYIMKSY